jgi:antitoxin CcdA
VIEQAKALNLNASEAAETGLRRAIADAQATSWREGSRAAIAAHNARVAERGMLLTSDWARED